MVQLVKIKTYWQAVQEPERDWEVPSGETLTVQEGYESLEDMIPRIVRGEIRPVVPEFEFKGEVEDSIFDYPVYDQFDDLTDLDDAKEVISSLRNSDVAAKGGRKERIAEDASIAREKLTDAALHQKPEEASEER